MSGLSPIHTSYLKDTTTVRQHFTCFEFTHEMNERKKRTQRKASKKNKIKYPTEKLKSEENK